MFSSFCQIGGSKQNPPVQSHALQSPLLAAAHVLINPKEHWEGHKEVDGIEQGPHAVHTAFVHEGVMWELWMLQWRRAAVKR
eukprot:scaffold21573_cov14-Tisochrysis_lutea.AAC.1